MVARPIMRNGLVSVGDGDPAELTVAEAAGAIRLRRMTALEYVDALLAQAERWSALNAFITFDADRLRSEAREIDNRIANGIEVGPLAGVPVTIKDNIYRAGVATTAGTAALADFLPAVDSPVVQRLVSAGALMAGKTNMHELAHMPSGRNPTYGHVRNPYNLNCTSGGSSAGTATAVTARIFPAGLGSDTGGSCRIPAALCGCVGFRPTHGRYSQDGLIMLSQTHDTIGLFARTVSDIALLDPICTGDLWDNQLVALHRVRIGIPRTFYDSLEAELAEVCDITLDALRNAGAILVEDEVPEIQELTARAAVILSYETPRDLEAFLQGNGLMPLELFLERLLDAATQSSIRQLAQNRISEQVYMQAVSLHRPALQARYAEYFSQHDLAAVLVPTTRAPAALVATDPVPSAANTYSASLAGLPCLSMPVGLTHDGLPVGMEFVGLSGEDELLIGLGRAVEEHLEPLPSPQLP